MLTVAGLQLPFTPLSEVEGNAGTDAPEQIESAVPKLNAGMVLGVTVTFRVKGNAHWPAAGVNVYEPEAVLLIEAGLQVPEMPLLDVAGRAGTVALAQTETEVPKVNAGVILGVTVTVKVAGVAQIPAVGVNV